VRKTFTAIALAMVLGITGLGSTLSASAASEPVRARVSCTPGYSPCIPNRASDVDDCYGGSGNGPRYTRPGVVYRVRGADRYRLDADNDGRGCE
jgi:micrococcal nuclease